METRISVSPQLGSLLQERQMSVAELLRRIEGRFGLAVEPKTLYRLTRPEPVQRTDLTIAAAAASVLDVTLDALFVVSEVPFSDVGPSGPDGAPELARRLSELFATQSTRELTVAEEVELRALLAQYAHAQPQSRIQSIAEKQGITIDDARREVETTFASVETEWTAFQRSPRARAA